MSLAEDVQITKTDLNEFRNITHRILEYLPNVINEEEYHQNYKLCSSNIAGTRKQIRPFNSDLFLREADNFGEHYDGFLNILENLKSNNRVFKDEDYQVIDKTIYTIQQALGIGLD